MGGGDRYLQCKKVIVPPHSGCSEVRSSYAVCSRCQCKKVNPHSRLSKYGWWGPLPLVQKDHCTPTQWTQLGVQNTVGAQYAVDVSAKKVNSHSGTQQIWVVGTATFSAKRSLYPHAVDAVDRQYAVGMQYREGMQYAVRYAVSTQQVCSMQQVHSIQQVHSRYAVCSKYTVRTLLTQWTQQIWVVVTATFSAKRSNPMQWGTQQVCSMQQVCSKQQVLVQKGQLTQWTQQILVVGTITFSAMRSLYPPCSGHSGCAVHSRCQCKKVNSHSGLSKYGW